jgi:hypothetical protein
VRERDAVDLLRRFIAQEATSQRGLHVEPVLTEDNGTRIVEEARKMLGQELRRAKASAGSSPPTNSAAGALNSPPARKR